MSKSAINKIKELLGMDVSLEQLMTASGVTLEADEFVPGNAVFVLNEDGEKFPAPEGSIPMEDGRTLTVDANGMIVSFGNAEETAPTEEQEMEKEAKKVVESTTKETHFEETPEVVEVLFTDAHKEAIKEIVLAVIEAQKEVKEEVKEELSEVKPLKHSTEKERETTKFNFSTERTSQQAKINKFLFG